MLDLMTGAVTQVETVEEVVSIREVETSSTLVRRQVCIVAVVFSDAASVAIVIDDVDTGESISLFSFFSSSVSLSEFSLS